MTKRRRLPKHVSATLEQARHELDVIIRSLTPIAEGKPMTQLHYQYRAAISIVSAQKTVAALETIETEARE